MYIVIKAFVDLQDNNYSYKAGDAYPRKGKEVSPERIAELSGKDNKQGVPLIAKAENTDKKAAAKKTADK